MCFLLVGCLSFCLLQGASSGSAQLAISVIHNCNEKLERCVCTFLRSCILNRGTIGSGVKESYHEIIFEIFQSAPQMLVSVIPSLSHELLVGPPSTVQFVLSFFKSF